MNPQRVLSEWGSKEWANDQLRFAIRVLQGKIVGSSDKGRIQIAILVEDRLSKAGFWWQHRILDHHLHLFMKNHGGSSR